LPAIVAFERPAGGAKAIAEAAKLLSEAKFPVILSGRRRRHRAMRSQIALRWPRSSMRRCAPTTSTTTAPRQPSPRLRPTGLQRLEGRHGADRQGRRGAGAGHAPQSSSTLPGYGIDYWPKTAKIIQVDINADRIGLTKPVTVGICGDAKLVAKQILAQLSPSAGMPDARSARLSSTRPSPPGCSNSPAWIMRTTIRTRPGT
jgi:sulfoacetaldehyde acetyltransferase